MTNQPGMPGRTAIRAAKTRPSAGRGAMCFVAMMTSKTSYAMRSLEPRSPAREREREIEARVRAAHGDAFQAEGIGEVPRDAAADDRGRAIPRPLHGLD